MPQDCLIKKRCASDPRRGGGARQDDHQRSGEGN